MERDDWVEYKSLCKVTKSAVSKSKLGKYDALYERLETKGEKEMYKLTIREVKNNAGILRI